MKINYIRNLTVSHMILEQRVEIEEWESEMIIHNKVNGILFAECVCENGESYLWYDITGKQALDVLLSSKEVDYRLLCKIMHGLCTAVCKLENLLLVSDSVLLLPDCIFMDNRTDEIFFCYYPGNEQELSVAVCNLMEYLLTRLDHKDQAAVSAAYALFEQVRKDGYSVADIRKMLCIPYEEEDKGLLQEMKGREGYVESIRQKEEGQLETGQIKENSITKNLQSQENVKNEESILHQWRDSILGKLKSGMKKLLPEKRKQLEPFAFEPEEEIGIKQGKPTVLLSEITKKPIGLLRYQGNGKCEDLKIDVLPYIIGSDASCDGYIESDTVSRRHARITKSEELYFIEDLNSSNGTFVGGQLLNYKVKMSLSSNETVKLADEIFRFI